MQMSSISLFYLLDVAIQLFDMCVSLESMDLPLEDLLSLRNTVNHVRKVNSVDMGNIIY